MYFILVFFEISGLAGSSSWEQALCDMYVDGVEDLNPQYAPVYRALFAKDENLKNENWNKFKQSTLGPFLDRYEKFLAESKSGWLVGSEVTILSPFYCIECFTLTYS